MSILLADDDVQLATFLSQHLESEGYAVHTALDENSAWAELRRQDYKLIILDLNFGQTDGLKLLEKIRDEEIHTPVIVLSARDRVSDRIQSLKLGADDYVTKPFSIQELVARACALLRRVADPSLNILRVEDLEVDPRLRRVTRGDRDIKLSNKEFDLLHLLMRRAGNEVTRQELLHEVWGPEPGSDSNLVDVYVNYLRKKVESSGEPKLIHTIRGVGYRLGREAPTVKGLSEIGHIPEQTRSVKTASTNGTAFTGSVEGLNVHQTPWRALVSSVAHDLAQPLTNIRCFLEVAVMKNSSGSSSASDLKKAEQQADRSIALAKTIASLVREVAVPVGPWVSLDSLLEDVFGDFVVLGQSELLTLERHWDTFIQVPSSPVLRQLLVLLVGKLAGKNACPLVLSVAAGMKGHRCALELQWRAAEQGAIQEAQTILGNDRHYIEEMVYSIGGELTIEGRTGISIKLPSAPHTGSQTKETVQ